jgi:hypothetical protein
MRGEDLKWLEQIRLQVPSYQRVRVVEVLRDALDQTSAIDGLIAVRLLENRHIDTELSLVLEWRVPPVGPMSATTERLLRLAGELGLAHHTSWRDVTSAAAVEKEDKQP